MRLALLLFLSSAFVAIDTVPVCVTGYTLVNNKCLRFVTTPASHAAAEATCAISGATLSTVKNAIDNRALASFVGTSTSQFWLGSFCTANDPSYCYWDDNSGSANSYSNFAKSFPYVDLGSCVYYVVTGSLAGQWMSANCNDNHPFVCELPATVSDSCLFNYNGYCYTPSRATSYGTLDFSEAQQACEHLGMNLASVHSVNEMRYIKSIHQGAYAAYAADDILIGGVQFAANSLGWTDGTPWDFDNFPRSYSRGCVHMSLSVATSGTWSVQDCELTGRFLCKRAAGAATPAPVTVTPSPTNAPSCNNSILLAPGAIRSTGYPGTYSNNLYCTYSLATLASSQVYLTFSAFLTETNRDIVTIYDGNSANSPQIGTFSGYLAPFSVKSTRNQMFLTFKTDQSNVYSGFYAKFVSLV